MKSLLLLLAILPLAAKPQLHEFKTRASELDSKIKEYPEIGFLIKDKKGKAQDTQYASVDTSTQSRGRLVIWLMSPNTKLFHQLNKYGLHTMQVAYANKWFSLCCKERPVGPHCRGNIRLEAATGEDHTNVTAIAKPDSIKGRALTFVKHLAKKNPEGEWGQFLNSKKDDLLWEKVILSGISHGSTTSARFAKHTKVARVVAFSGPRDQYQDWQARPSATPKNRYFGFTHIQDSGWEADHYCRSWELLGMHQFGPIVNVEKSKPPYGNTRRLITDFDVKNDAKVAHGAVIPRKGSLADKKGNYLHEPVWRYLFTHPVGSVGKPVPMDDSCLKKQKQ
jgi:hypothetical protein